MCENLRTILESEHKEHVATYAKVDVQEDNSTRNIDPETLEVQSKDEEIDQYKDVPTDMADTKNCSRYIVNNKEDNKKNFTVNGYQKRRKQKQLPVTWVQFQGYGGSGYASSAGASLDYDPESRNSFVMIIFIIVFIMILCTAGITTVVMTVSNLKRMFLVHGLFLVIPAMGLMLAMNYAMACSQCTRRLPCNIICLMLTVIAMSVITSYITVRFETRLILYAVLATAATVFVCILLACTSFDFTQWLLYVIVIATAFAVITMIISVTMLFTNTHYKPLHLIILFVGTLINVVIFTIELQTILGGKAVELSEDDYAFGAFMIYTSVIDIFLKLIQIIGAFSDDDY